MEFFFSFFFSFFLFFFFAREQISIQHGQFADRFSLLEANCTKSKVQGQTFHSGNRAKQRRKKEIVFRNEFSGLDELNCAGQFPDSFLRALLCRNELHECVSKALHHSAARHCSPPLSWKFMSRLTFEKRRWKWRDKTRGIKKNGGIEGDGQDGTRVNRSWQFKEYRDIREEWFKREGYRDFRIHSAFEREWLCAFAKS